MATFAELRNQLREAKIVEESTDFYGEDELLRFLHSSSLEIAAALRFPRVYETVPVIEGASEAALPSGAIDVEGVTFNGIRVGRIALPHVRFYQGFPKSGFPRGWYFDPMRGGNVIQVGPPVPAGSFEVEYVSTLGGTPNASNPPWTGLFPEFHELVVLRAAVRAFEKGMEMETSAYYLQRYDGLLQEFAMFLGQSVPRGLVARDAT